MVSAKLKNKKQQPNRKSKPMPQDSYDWLHQIAFWGLALLLFFPPYFRGLFFAPEQEKALILAALVFWIIFLWRWLQRDCKLLATPLDWFALALPAVYILAAFGAVNKGLAAEEVVKNILYFLTFWSVARLVRQEKDAESIITVIYISAVGVALAGLAAATGIISIKDGFLGGRLYSSFQYPNALAAYLGAVLFMGVYLWNRALDDHREALKTAKEDIWTKLERINLWGYLYACGNFLLLTVLFGTKSRGGLLVFALVLIIYFIGIAAKTRFASVLHTVPLAVIALVAANRFTALALQEQAAGAWLWIAGGLALSIAGHAAIFRLNLSGNVRTALARKLPVTLGVLAIIAIVVLGTWFMGNDEVLNKITGFDYLENAYQRGYYMQYAAEMIKERPLMGWGGGGWEEAYRSFMDYHYTTRQVHSYLFQVGVETGITGSLVVLGLWFFFLYMAHRLYHSSMDNPLRRQLTWTLTAAFLMITGHSFIDFDLSLSALAIVLWACMGIIAGLSGKGESQQADSQQSSHVRNFRPSYITTGLVTVLVIGIILAGACLQYSRSLMSWGVSLLNAGQVSQGLEHVEKAVQYNPFKASYRIAFSQVYAGLNQDDKALGQARRAVELSRYDTAPRENLAKVAMGASQSEEAAKAAAAVIELAPHDIRSYETSARLLTQLGLNELKEGHRDKAEQLFKQVIKVAETSSICWKNLDDKYKKLWRGPKLEITPELLLFTGQAQYWMGDFSTAAENLQKAAEDTKLKEEAYLYLALVKQKQDLLQEADTLLAEAGQASAVFEEIKDLPVLSD